MYRRILRARSGNEREDAARQQVAFDFAKPEFDLVEPGGVGRREVELDRADVPRETPAPPLVLWAARLSTMTWIASPRVRRHDVAEELDEGLAGVPRHGLTQDLAGAACSARRTARACHAGRYSKPWRSARPGDNGNTGIQPVECLNGRFLIDGDHHGMLAADSGTARSHRRPSARSPDRSTACSARSGGAGTPPGATPARRACG